jgi:hypothetical protein
MLSRVLRTALVVAVALGFLSCSPYASINIGAPFKVGPVYVNPSIGLGGFLR